ncbi:hypothetical protein UA08_05148 [Talaromyces atroroseus]|uniref:Uncharacterized protein n=1 Tax=Talaromyces atroroseus TaxID=1441469 RepID=A0A225AM10_TALAT|nr:hypothetical protein UA08_05148 [Talaromyces atroroseus]OKL59354.1 hypothetical protein UA08_05148 [Talaromyces atroroseus]
MNALAITSKRVAAHNSYRSLWRALRDSKHGLPKSNSLQVRLRSTTETMPKIAQASTWTSIIPKFLRDRSLRTATSAQAKSKEWNPATFYIVIFTLIGSQAIQMLVLRKELENYTRRSDAKLRLLAEVIQKVKNGENVDVERLLGTDDETKEREWEEVLREIEDEDSLWRQKSGRKRDSNSAESAEDDKRQKSVAIEKERLLNPEKSLKAPEPSSVESPRNARFY